MNAHAEEEQFFVTVTPLVQWHASSDVSGDVQVFALMNSRLAFIESALGNNGKRQLRLQHLRLVTLDAAMARNGGLALMNWLYGKQATINSRTCKRFVPCPIGQVWNDVLIWRTCGA